MHRIRPEDLLNSLPIPCIYFTGDRIIVYANVAAQEIVGRSHDCLQGCPIDSTNIRDTLDNATDLDQAVSELSDHGAGPPNSSITLNARNFIWQLCMTNIHSQMLFCLTASPRMDDATLLSNIVRPSFVDVDYPVAMISQDLSSRKANRCGEAILEDAARRQFLDPTSKSFGSWNEDFTRQLPISESAAGVALSTGKSQISIKRGVQNSSTGVRVVVDTTVTILDRPSGGQLGCLIQTRPAEEWSEYLKRYDINNTTSSALVRTMLLDGTLDFFCAASEAFFQRSCQDLCNSWKDYVHPEDLSRIQGVISSCLSGGQAQECQVRYLDGKSYRYFSDRIAPFKLNGETTRWYCISTDVHDFVSNQNKANLARDRLVGFLEDMDANIFEVDTNSIFTVCDGNLMLDVETLEFPVTRFAHKTLSEVHETIDPEDKTGLRKACADLMAGNINKSVLEYEVGSRHLQTHMAPVRSETAFANKHSAANGIYGITLDVTAQRESKQAKIKLQAMAESSRLKDQFVANVSHELRTPIAGLTGLLELLLETDLTGAQLDLILGLRTSATALSRIVNDILDFSKAEANAILIENRPFDLSRLLFDIKRTHEAVADKKGLSLQADIQEGLQMVVGDALRVRQILDNLISNAIKFTECGSVRLSAFYELRHGGITARITVEDTGAGMDEKTLARLFQPFVQADQSTTRLYGGTGLGLSIARKLARLMGGEVSLTSVQDSGATSTLVLPFELDPGSKRINRSSQTYSAQQVPISQRIHDLRVLVVEDNPVNLTVILGHLKKLGVEQVDSALNGLEAVTHITSTAHLPDLVFMDCQMPILDGFDATRQLRTSLQYDKPIIALTASATPGYRQKCLDAGMNDYVTKPFVRQQLYDTMLLWLENTTNRLNDQPRHPELR